MLGWLDGWAEAEGWPEGCDVGIEDRLGAALGWPEGGRKEPQRRTGCGKADLMVPMRPTDGHLAASWADPSPWGSHLAG